MFISTTFHLLVNILVIRVSNVAVSKSMIAHVAPHNHIFINAVPNSLAVLVKVIQ